MDRLTTTPAARASQRVVLLLSAVIFINYVDRGLLASGQTINVSGPAPLHRAMIGGTRFDAIGEGREFRITFLAQVTRRDLRDK